MGRERRLHRFKRKRMARCASAVALLRRNSLASAATRVSSGPRRGAKDSGNERTAARLRITRSCRSLSKVRVSGAGSGWRAGSRPPKLDTPAPPAAAPAGPSALPRLIAPWIFVGHGRDSAGVRHTSATGRVVGTESARGAASDRAAVCRISVSADCTWQATTRRLAERNVRPVRTRIGQILDAAAVLSQLSLVTL